MAGKVCGSQEHVAESLKGKEVVSSSKKMPGYQVRSRLKSLMNVNSVGGIQVEVG